MSKTRLILSAAGLLLICLLELAQVPDVGKIRALYREALQFRQAGKPQEAICKLEEIIKIDPLTRGAYFEIACLYSELNEKIKAIVYLERAIKMGLINFKYIKNEKRLDNIRKTNGYKKLMENKAKLAREGIKNKLKFYRNLLGEDYAYDVLDKEKFALALSVDRATYEILSDRLKSYSRAQSKHLFKNKIESYVLIVITTDEDWTSKLHHHPRSRGGYSPEDQVLSIKEIETVFHEFTHAMHGADQDALNQKHPIWITEGIACHFEAFDIVGDMAFGRSNHRLLLLQYIIDTASYISWNRLFSMDNREFMANSKISYAESGFIIHYLQAKGLLEKWYSLYCKTYKSDPTGRSTLEKIFGKKLPQIEVEWKEWVKKLPQSPLRTIGS